MFTVKEAAEQLGISLTLMYGLLKAKRIRHERHGLGRGTIRIPADAIEEYRAGRTVAVRTARPAPAATPRYRHLKLS